MGKTNTTTSATAASAAPHPPPPHKRDRLRQFISHDGRKIKTDYSPEEAETLRQQHMKSTEPIDLYINGSPEHLDILRKTNSHHERCRAALREQCSDIYDQFQHVHAELDALANEFEQITDREVQLDANFSKYGYSAQLRSYGDLETRRSGTSSPRSSTDKDSEQAYTSPLKLFRVPVVRQYFHKGLLWRASDQQEVESFVLFVDLLYVGIIAINGDFASEDATGLSLLRFVITFTLSYKIWSDMNLMVSWYDRTTSGEEYRSCSYSPVSSATRQTSPCRSTLHTRSS